MDASKYFCGATLCELTSQPDSLDDLKHVNCIPDKLYSTQSNYGALFRETFAIYI